jgi:hypothetical protein
MGGRRGHGEHAAGCVEVMMIMVGLCSLSCGGGTVISININVGISSKLNQISSVRGTSMSENRNTKVCRHTRKHVAKFALSGQK